VEITNEEEVTPPPQDLEHVHWACQYPTQLMGQGVVLQTAVAVAEVLLQGVPPFCAGVVMAYAEVLNPPPQLLEHAPGACQLPTQLMGQG
jgi:hypothetical protein